MDGREDAIQQYFVEQYGARVLAEPPRTGLNWLVYVLPPLIILAGVILLDSGPSESGRRSLPRRPGGCGTVEKPSRRSRPTSTCARLEDELKKRA